MRILLTSRNTIVTNVLIMHKRIKPIRARESSSKSCLITFSEIRPDLNNALKCGKIFYKGGESTSELALMLYQL